MAATPEGRVKAKIKAYLQSIPGCWYYMPVSNGMGRVGCPDLLVCIAGQLFAFEVKAPGKRRNTTPNQDREIEWINFSGGIAIVVDDVSQVEEAIRNAKVIPPRAKDEGGVQQAP